MSDEEYALYKAYKDGYMAALNKVASDPTFAQQGFEAHIRQAEWDARHYSDGRPVRRCECWQSGCWHDYGIAGCKYGEPIR